MAIRGADQIMPDSRRVGFLVQDGEEGLTIAAGLFETINNYELHVPLGETLHDQIPRCWFLFGSDRHVKAPTVLGFVDDIGAVVLVGCQAVSHRRSGRMGIGRGVIIPNYLVLGPFHTGYDTVHAVRTSWTHLAEWCGLSAVDWEVTRQEELLVRDVSYHLRSGDPVLIGEEMGLAFVASWDVPSEHDRTTTIRDLTVIETRHADGQGWDAHLWFHEAIRELVLLSCWQPVGLRDMTVFRDDDPDLSLGGTPHGLAWRRVQTHRLPKSPEQAAHAWFLFRLEDIGVSGILTWFDVRRTFSRTFEELVSIRDGGPASMSNLIAATGMALEYLGHQLAVEAGELKPDEKLTYRQYLDAVLADLVYLPVPDAMDWKQRAINCYMGLKHPDRLLPDMGVLEETYFDNLLIIRVWLAGRLGCPASVLERSVMSDPHTNHSRRQSSP